MRKIALIGLALFLSSCDTFKGPYLINNYPNSIRLTIIQDTKQSELVLKPCQGVLIGSHYSQGYNIAQIVIKTNENEEILSLTRKQINTLLKEYGDQARWNISPNGLKFNNRNEPCNNY